MKPSGGSLFSAHALLATLRGIIHILRWAMLVLALVYLCSGITVVGSHENALILRFGKLLPDVHPPGLLFALPPPFDEVILVPVKNVQERILTAWTSTDDGNESFHPLRNPSTLTGDANIVRLEFIVRYQVGDPGKYALVSNARESLLDAVIYREACRLVAGMSIDDALTLNRERIGQEARRKSQEELDRLGLGIDLLAVEVREIAPPRAVAAAFQDVISAKVQGRTLVEPAKTYRVAALADANAKAYRVRTEAEAYAGKIRAQAEGEASAFAALLTEYAKAPDLLRSRLFAENMQDTLANVRTATVLPKSNGKVHLLLHPQFNNFEDAATAHPEGGE